MGTLMATNRRLTGARERLRKRVLRTLPECADRMHDWRPTRTPSGTIAVACTPTWEDAPQSLTFYRDVPTGKLACVAQYRGVRGQIALVDDDGGGWATRIMPFGNPTRN